MSVPLSGQLMTPFSVGYSTGTYVVPLDVYLRWQYRVRTWKISLHVEYTEGGSNYSENVTMENVVGVCPTYNYVRPPRPLDVTTVPSGSPRPPADEVGLFTGGIQFYTDICIAAEKFVEAASIRSWITASVQVTEPELITPTQVSINLYMYAVFAVPGPPNDNDRGGGLTNRAITVTPPSTPIQDASKIDTLTVQTSGSGYYGSMSNLVFTPESYWSYHGVYDTTTGTSNI